VSEEDVGESGSGIRTNLLYIVFLGQVCLRLFLPSSNRPAHRSGNHETCLEFSDCGSFKALQRRGSEHGSPQQVLRRQCSRSCSAESSRRELSRACDTAVTPASFTSPGRLSTKLLCEILCDAQ
jgi:hypothetical protein